MNKAIVVKLTHDEYEDDIYKYIESVLPNNERGQVKIACESYAVSKRYHFIYMEDPVFISLQFCISFLIALKDQNSHNLMCGWHGTFLSDCLDLSIERFITQLGSSFLFHLKQTNLACRRFIPIFKEKTPYYCWLYEILTISIKFIDELYESFDESFDESSDDTAPIKYRHIIDDIWFLFEEIENGLDNKKSIGLLKNIPVGLRDEHNAKILMETAEKNPWIILVGSAHAKTLTNTLSDNGWDVNIIEKYDMDAFKLHVDEFLEISK